jgi:SAM-dependent methyltransferase
MLKRLKKYFQKQQFNPGVLGIFINPHYFMRRAIMKALREAAPEITGKVLDVGCGSMPYREPFKNISEYVGMEFDSAEQRATSKAEVFYDGKSFPFPDNTFDSVIFTEVLEHIFNPDEFLAEINRVLKPDGKILLSTPFVWYEHSQPYDYGRYSSFGLKHLLNKHGFEILSLRKLGSEVASLFQLWNGYIYKKINPIKYYKIKLILFVIFISPFTIIGTILSAIMPDQKELYLDNFVLAKK